MILIEQVVSPKMAENIFYIYEKKQSFKLKETVTVNSRQSLKAFSTRLTAYRPAFSLIELNMLYRQLFYTQCPETCIVVKPAALFRIVEKKWPVKEAIEEIAIGLERESQGLEMDVLSFVSAFYKEKTKDAAIRLYENWQLALPVRSETVWPFVQLFELYFDEIINYFELRKVYHQVKN